jgi:hypothetical protein
MKQLLLLLMIVPATLFGQTYFGLGANLGGFARAGTWDDTYGIGFETGGRLEFGNSKGLIIALQGDVLFGQNVRVDPIAALRNEAGLVTGDIFQEGTFADIILKARGFRGSVLVGYQYTLTQSGFGVRMLAGPSYLTHHIRIQDDANQTTSNLRDEYKRGYDRRAGGYGGYGEIGFEYAESSNSFRVYAVLTGSFTQSSALNSTQFDLLEVAPQDGTDLSLGGRVGIVLGLLRNVSSKQAEDIYY